MLGTFLILLLLLLAAPVIRAPWSGNTYTCSNGCSAINTVGGSMQVITDDGTYCEVMCCPGRMVTLVAANNYSENPPNIAQCDGSSNHWCINNNYYQMSTQPKEIQCIDTTSIIDIPQRLFSGCCSQIARTGAPTNYPTCALGRCASFVAFDGVEYVNRCAQFDTGATCTDDESQPMCTCSAGWTDTYCGVATPLLGTIAPLAGASQNAISILNMLEESKASGTAIFMSNMPALLSFLSDQQRVELSYNISDLIVEAAFEGTNLELSTSFTVINDPSLGSCFTFNHWNASFFYTAEMMGPRGGLDVELDVDPAEYLPFIDTMGVNVYITEIGSDIYIETNKLTSQPGGWDRLMITQTSSSKLINYWRSECAKDKADAQSFYFSGNYSVDGCYRSCYQDSCYAACGCMDPMFQRKQGVAACNFDQLSCIFAMIAKRGDPSNWHECHCPQPCASKLYDIAYSRGALTSKKVCEQSGVPYNSSETCKPRTSIVTVGFRTFEVVVQAETEKYPLSRVFGNIGNVGGILLGFSMVCFFEGILFVIAIACYGAGKPDDAPLPGAQKKE